MKIICIDIDSTICNTTKNYYASSTPKKNVINFINKLYSKGYVIKLYTARGMGRSKDNKKLAEKKFKKLTIKQLKLWKVKYHSIFFGKPSADLYVDDKSFGYRKSWINSLKYLLNE